MKILMENLMVKDVLKFDEKTCVIVLEKHGKLDV